MNVNGKSGCNCLQTYPHASHRCNGFRATLAAERPDRAPAQRGRTIKLLPNNENISAGAKCVQATEAAALREEVARLRQQLSIALEMLQIMQEELQRAHDELTARAWKDGG